MTDATATAATTTAVTIGTVSVIGQKGPNLVNIAAAFDEPRAKSNYDEQYKKILEGPCPLHKNSKHKMKDCLGLAKEFYDKKKDSDNDDGARGPRPPGDNNNAFLDHDKVVATIFRGLAATESR